MATCPFCEGVVEAALTREGGPCPRCMVKEQMRANRADIKRCYENALRLDETLSGRWTFRFVILPSGATDPIKITGERMKSESLETCFAREVRGWTFQRIDKAIPVSIGVPLGT